MHRSLLLLLPFIAGYWLSYLYRTINAILAPVLSTQLELHPEQLGLLTSAYFLTCALFQLPLGLLLDHYGPGRVHSALLLLTAAGAALFASSDSYWGLLAARALIGWGCSAGLMAAIKAISLWYPPEDWPLLNGLMIAVGGVGAATATWPVETALNWLSWRELFWVLAIISSAISAWVLFAVPATPKHEHHGDTRALFAGVAQVLRSAAFWRIAPVTMWGLGVNMSMQGLWTGPWFEQANGWDRPAVASGLLSLAMVMVVAQLSTGFAARKLQQHGIKLSWMIAVGAGWSLLFYLPLIAGSQQLWPWVAQGFGSAILALSYSWMPSAFSHHLAGRAITCFNLLVFLACFAVQAGFGSLLELFSGAGSTPVASSFQHSMAVMLCIYLLCWLWLLHGLYRKIV